MVEIMDIQSQLQLLTVLEDAAFQVVSDINKLLPPGTKVRVREKSYNTFEIVEQELTVKKVTYYDSTLCIQCEDKDEMLLYYNQHTDIEVIS